MGILTQSGRGFPIHVCTVGTYHYYWHAAMGEKIATQSFPSGGAVGSVLELSRQNCDGVSSERFWCTSIRYG